MPSSTTGTTHITGSDPSPHGPRHEERLGPHVAELLGEPCERGSLVIDLSPSTGHYLADVVTERGFTYLACPAGVDEPERLGQALSAAAGGRSVAALLLLNALQSSADWPALLDGLRQAVLALSRPVLIVGVPNLANLGNVAALLLPTNGDQLRVVAEPLSGWTARHLEHELSRRGWVRIGASDVGELSSEIPDLGRQAPLTMFLRELRALADDTGDKSTLLRSFALSASRPSTREGESGGPESSPAPFISVAVRTQGTRQPMLLEALTCLAAQTDDDFEVLLVVHSSDEGTVEAVHALVDRFDAQFRAQVRVIPVEGGGRSRPLNTALDLSRGTYLTFLDDDDLVTANWVETFHSAAMASAGSVIRSVSAERRVHRCPRGQLSDYEPRGRLLFPYPAKFDFMEHLIDNSSPICSVALPLAAIRRFSIRFDDHLDALEDWDVLMRVAPFAGVVDTGEPTSVYHRWDGDESSSSTVSPTAWLAARHTVRKRLDHLALLLPPGMVSALVQRFRTDEDWERRRAEVSALHATVADLSAQLHEIRSSEWWRVTMPIRALATKVRRRSRNGPAQSGG